MADPVEIMQRALARDWWAKGLSDYETAEEQERDWMVPLFAAQRVAVIQALEAAGYRIAGPEPTGEMIIRGEDKEAATGKMTGYMRVVHIWKAMFAKLPLYGSE